MLEDIAILTGGQAIAEEAGKVLVPGAGTIFEEGAAQRFGSRFQARSPVHVNGERNADGCFLSPAAIQAISFLIPSPLSGGRR